MYNDSDVELLTLNFSILTLFLQFCSDSSNAVVVSGFSEVVVVGSTEVLFSSGFFEDGVDVCGFVVPLSNSVVVDISVVVLLFDSEVFVLGSPGVLFSSGFDGIDICGVVVPLLNSVVVDISVFSLPVDSAFVVPSVSDVE